MQFKQRMHYYYRQARHNATDIHRERREESQSVSGSRVWMLESALFARQSIASLLPSIITDTLLSTRLYLIIAFGS